MTIYPTRAARLSSLSEEDKALLGGFESLTLFNPNLSDHALELFVSTAKPSMKSEDGKVIQYDNGDDVISDFFNNEGLYAQLTEDDIKIFNLIDSNYQGFEIRVK